MTRYLSLAEVLKLHGLIIARSGGSDGLRDLGMLESALGQPRQTFGGEDLYPSLTSKAAALGFGLTYMGRLVVVAHVESDSSIRIISARLATTTERRFYEQES